MAACHTVGGWLRLVSRLSIVGSVAIALYFSYLILFPAPLVVEASESGGQVYFASDRRVVVAVGDCVTVRWSVENIRAVFLNEQPQIGSGEVNQCLTATARPELKVVFRDDSQRVFRLSVNILVIDPLSWGLIALGIVFVGHAVNSSGIYLSSTKIRGLLTIRTFLAVVSLMLALYLFVTQVKPLTDTFATAKYWLDASGALTTLLNHVTLLMLLGLAIFIRVQKWRQAEAQPKSVTYVWGWAAGFGMMLAVAVFTIVYVNPRGMYPTSNFEPHQLLLRDKKPQGYVALPETPDLVVLGSSRAFTISPAFIRETTGYTAYNMSMEGGRTEDILVASRFMLDQHDHRLPEVLFIEVQEGLPRQPTEIATRAPFWWLRYIDFDSARFLIQRRFEALFELRHFAEALHIARYNAIYNQLPKEWPRFEADGLAVRPLVSPQELEHIVPINIATIVPMDCTRVDPRSQSEIDQLVELAEQQHTSIVFYLSPWHPQYYNKNMRDNPSYRHCYDLFVEYMSALVQSHDQVFFLDYSLLSSIDGLDTVEGYYDSDHLAPENSNRLIQQAASTIHEAYRLAAERRDEAK